MDVETFMEKFKQSLELKTFDYGVSEGEELASVRASQADTIGGSEGENASSGEEGDRQEFDGKFQADYSSDYSSVEESQSVLGPSDDEQPPSASGVTSYGAMQSILYENEKKNWKKKK